MAENRCGKDCNKETRVVRFKYQKFQVSMYINKFLEVNYIRISGNMADFGAGVSLTEALQLDIGCGVKMAELTSVDP